MQCNVKGSFITCSPSSCKKNLVRVLVVSCDLPRLKPKYCAGPKKEEDSARYASYTVDHNLQCTWTNEAALPLQCCQLPDRATCSKRQCRWPVHLLCCLLSRSLGPHHGCWHWIYHTGVLLPQICDNVTDLKMLSSCPVDTASLFVVIETFLCAHLTL